MAPAITQHGYGKGMVPYVSAYLDEDSQNKLLDKVWGQEGVEPVMMTTPGIEACRRVAENGREIFIWINHTGTEQETLLPWQSAFEHLRGAEVGNRLRLEPYGIAVLTEPNKGK